MQIVKRQALISTPLDASLPNILDRVLRHRGIQSIDEIDMQTKSLLHYKLLKDIDIASSLMVEAIKQQSLITIVGDFDADGATSTALCMLCLRDFGHHKTTYIVPNRFDYGYGLSPPVVDIAHEMKTDLLVTVDNGISSIEGVKYAKSLGIKVIVTDHHLAPENLPIADAIVNPNQPGCEFPSKNLAGVGVAFYLMLSVRAKLIQSGYFEEKSMPPPNIASYLDIVALGTVADVVPLDKNNRILVHQGLQRIRSGRTRHGIQALLDVAGRNATRLASADLGFALGPRLNAAGRLEDMSVGIECLLTEDQFKARKLASELDGLNRSRQEIQQDMQIEAEKALSSLALSGQTLPAGLCVYDESFHAGVVGIVAGKLKEQYYRPTIVFAKENETTLKGSARSIAGVHIRDVLESIHSRNPSLITKFGGHAMAAGLSLPIDAYAEFSSMFAESVHDAMKGLPEHQQMLSDGELSAIEMSLDNAQILKCHLPWGQGFEAPVFDGVFNVVQQRLVGQKHLKLVLSKDRQVFDGIAFNVDVEQWPNESASRVHIAYQLDLNEFKNRVNVQLLINDLVVAS
ncbi:single-stranded-DNA-specific exonuclease RecJ [Agaribacter marinus]|uniref:Single-stranded-DNA-specific exonuclease RecJ n=1 Tax=Agaribacter marinus TaxID=1431249 RepID=A0AA37T2F6_9ALTE|nr:single-stranded-DNA-specific exonuclease RecJ [Agaribacter marinus]GLR72719.1 single-stranded-DNA-specific exonuclease RecJ [Agaribacter marinus]